MKTQFTFQIERVFLSGGFTTDDLRLIIIEHDFDCGERSVFDIIQDHGEKLKRSAKNITLDRADMDAEEFEFLWKRALRALKEKDSR